MVYGVYSSGNEHERSTIITSKRDLKDHTSVTKNPHDVVEIDSDDSDEVRILPTRDAKQVTGSDDSRKRKRKPSKPEQVTTRSSSPSKTSVSRASPLLSGEKEDELLDSLPSGMTRSAYRKLRGAINSTPQYEFVSFSCGPGSGASEHGGSKESNESSSIESETKHKKSKHGKKEKQTMRRSTSSSNEGEQLEIIDSFAYAKKVIGSLSTETIAESSVFTIAATVLHKFQVSHF